MNQVIFKAMLRSSMMRADASRVLVIWSLAMIAPMGLANPLCLANQNVRTAGSDVSQSVADTPWYDAEQKQVRPITVQPRQDDSVHRDSRWLPKPKTIARPESIDSTSSTAGGNASTDGLFGTSLTIGNVFGWVLLAATVMAVVGIIVYGISRAELSMADRKASGSSDADGSGLPDEQTLERIKHLPPELRRTDVNLRTECERLMNERCFEQAIILLLGHQLLLLDSNGLLRLSRGKTNGRYVRDTRTNDESCAGWLRQTADAFEQSYFGRHEIPAEVFAQLWRQNEMLESSAQSYGVAK